MATPEHHAHDYVAENRAHYDERAKAIDADEELRQLARQVAEGLLRVHGPLFDKGTTTLLDFACGTGLVSLELFPHVKSVLGVDISPGVVEQYNKKAEDRGIDPECMKAICTELKGNGDELGGAKFDVVLCSMAYHHLPSIADTTKILASLLRPGGSLLVVDLITPGGAGRVVVPEQYHHVVPHRRGFSEDEIRTVFAGAGLRDVAFGVVAHLSVPRLNLDDDACVARGVKAES